MTAVLQENDSKLLFQMNKTIIRKQNKCLTCNYKYILHFKTVFLQVHINIKFYSCTKFHFDDNILILIIKALKSNSKVQNNFLLTGFGTFVFGLLLCVSLFLVYLNRIKYIPFLKVHSSALS